MFLLVVPTVWCHTADRQDKTPSPIVLQWGFVYMPPLVYLGEDGLPKGVVAEIMAGTSLYSGISYEPFEFPNARAIYSLNDQQVNFAIGVKSLVQNPKEFVFSALPVAKMQLTILWQKDTENVISLDDLQGKRIVLLAGYTYNGLRSKLEKIAQSYVDVETHERAISALKLKRGNYALVYKTASAYSIAPDEQLNFKNIVVAEVDLYFTLSKTVPEVELVMQRLEAGFLRFQESQD